MGVGACVGVPARCLPSAHPRASSPPADRPLRLSHTKVGQESRVRRVSEQDHERKSSSPGPGSLGGWSAARKVQRVLSGVSGACGMFRGTGLLSPPLSSEPMIAEQQPLPAARPRPRFARRAACWYFNVVGTCLYSGGNFSAYFSVEGWKVSCNKSVVRFSLLFEDC